MSATINSRLLRASDVPSTHARWQTISRFALTFDGYQRWGSFERCARIANERRHRTIDDLRTCLFFEQRRWRHFGQVPDAKAMRYIRGLLDKLRRMVKARREDVTTARHRP